jgi:hypothetical protein
MDAVCEKTIDALIDDSFDDRFAHAASSFERADMQPLALSLFQEC